MSLARGLDYYTGIIYECVVEGSAPPGFATTEATPAIPAGPSAANGEVSAATSSERGKSSSRKKVSDTNEEDAVDESQIGVGSIAAGGRYDNLVGMFAGATGPNSKSRVPCVGISFGVERIFSILQSKQKAAQSKMRTKEVDVFVMSLGDGMLIERMAVVSELWAAGIRVSRLPASCRTLGLTSLQQTEYTYKVKPKAAAQWDAADKDSIPLVVIVAPDEWAQDKVRVKEQLGKEATGEGAKGEVVTRDRLVDYVKSKLMQSS